MRRLLDAGDDGPRRRRLLAIAIVALLVIDAVLVGWALLSSRSAPDAGGDPAPTSAGPIPEPSLSAPEATAPPVDSPSPAPDASSSAVGTRLLAVGGQGVLWRATVGSCDAGGGLVQVSLDAGATWGDVVLPSTTLSSVRAIVTGPANAQASVVYTDEACQLAAQRTFDGGGGWQTNPDVLAVTSYLSGDGSIVLAGSQVAAPCDEPRMVRGPSAVLCADGLYVGSAAGWSAPVGEVVAIAPYDEQRVVAASTGDESCAGVSVSFVSIGDGSQSAVACAEVPVGSDVAVGAGGTTAWVWSGDEVVAVSLA